MKTRKIVALCVAAVVALAVSTANAQPPAGVTTADLLVRLFGQFVALVVVWARVIMLSALVTGVCGVLFRTRWWDRWFGKGEPVPAGVATLEPPAHIPSHFFPNVELRPVVAAILGIYLSIAFDLTLITHTLGLRAEDIVGRVGTFALFVDKVCTGLIVSVGGVRFLRASYRRIISKE